MDPFPIVFGGNAGTPDGEACGVGTAAACIKLVAAFSPMHFSS